MRLSVLSRVKWAMRSHSAAFSRYSLSLFMAKPLSPSLSCFNRSPSQWLFVSCFRLKRTRLLSDFLDVNAFNIDTNVSG